MAVYGDMLGFFPEIMKEVEYFSMKPQVVASYSNRVSLGKVTGTFQFIRRGELRREADTLSEQEVPTFWSKAKLQVGNFLTIEDIDYRINCNDDWMHAGGFYCYELETFIGSSDKQEEFEDVNVGIGHYA